MKEVKSKDKDTTKEDYKLNLIKRTKDRNDYVMAKSEKKVKLNSEKSLFNMEFMWIKIFYLINIKIFL